MPILKKNSSQNIELGVRGQVLSPQLSDGCVADLGNVLVSLWASGTPPIQWQDGRGRWVRPEPLLRLYHVSLSSWLLGGSAVFQEDRGGRTMGKKHVLIESVPLPLVLIGGKRFPEAPTSLLLPILLRQNWVTWLSLSTRHC